MDVITWRKRIIAERVFIADASIASVDDKLRLLVFRNLTRMLNRS